MGGRAWRVMHDDYLVGLGHLNERQRQEIVNRHAHNVKGGLRALAGRGPTKCEKEMSKLKWCKARVFLKAIEKTRRPDSSSSGIVVEGFDGIPFRSWMTKPLQNVLAQSEPFRTYCLRPR